MKNKFVKDFYDFFDTLFPNISMTADANMLYENLEYDMLFNINEILGAHFKNRIEIIEPRFDNDTPDFEGAFEIIYTDKKYAPCGLEELVLKWANDYECTDYLIDCLRD